MVICMDLKDIKIINENSFIEYIDEWNNAKEKIYPLKSDPKDLDYETFKDKIIKDKKSELLFFTSENGYIYGGIDINYNTSNNKDLYSFSNINFGVRPSERNKNLAFIMIKLALNKLRINGITKAYVVINRNNKACRNTLKKVSGELLSSKIIKGKVFERYKIDL